MLQTFHERNPLKTKSIKKWQKEILKLESVQKRSRGHQCSLSDARMKDIQEAFNQNPCNSRKQHLNYLLHDQLFIMCLIEVVCNQMMGHNILHLLQRMKMH